MLLSAECTVEVVKHMLTIEERGVLRQTCKAFREVRVQEDFFHAPYTKMLSKNGLRLIMRGDELVIKSNGWVECDPLYKAMKNILPQFARVIKAIHKDAVTENSVISVDWICNALRIDAPNSDNDGMYTATYSAYDRHNYRFNVSLNTCMIMEVLSKDLVVLPTPVTSEDTEDFYVREFAYIGYPKLILSP